MRGHRVAVAALASSLILVLAAGCASSQLGANNDKAAVTSTWTSFFKASTPIKQKALLLENGEVHVRDIGLYFSLLPRNLTTKVDSVKFTGSTAAVAYQFFSGKTLITVRPQTGTAVRVGGRWLVSASTWAKLVKQSDIHGSG